MQPISTERSGISIKYHWEKEIKPGEALVVTGTTNYTFPFILLILIIIVGVSAKLYYSNSVSLTKRVSFVKTRGGEFAVKVVLYVKTKKHIENLQVIDRLPGSTQLYEKFGMKPDRIDHATRRLIWNVHRLNAGEERVFSYIIYSKLKIVGKFELPSATAIFESEGKSNEVFSNKTYFMNETVKQED